MLSETLDHILNCTEKLFRTGSEKSGKSPSVSKHSSNKSTHRHKERRRKSIANAPPISNGGKQFHRYLITYFSKLSLKIKINSHQLARGPCFIDNDNMIYKDG